MSAAGSGPSLDAFDIVLARVVQGRVEQHPLRVPAGSTVGSALRLACARGLVDPAEVAGLGTAVFGRARGEAHPLHAGDRLELLAPVTVDPKVARARRVAHRRAALPRDKWRPDGA